jgi:hypothetical protein
MSPSLLNALVMAACLLNVSAKYWIHHGQSPYADQSFAGLMNSSFAFSEGWAFQFQISLTIRPYCSSTSYFWMKKVREEVLGRKSFGVSI